MMISTSAKLPYLLHYLNEMYIFTATTFFSVPIPLLFFLFEYGAEFLVWYIDPDHHDHESDQPYGPGDPVKIHDALQLKTPHPTA